MFNVDIEYNSCRFSVFGRVGLKNRRHSRLSCACADARGVYQEAMRSSERGGLEAERGVGVV